MKRLLPALIALPLLFALQFAVTYAQDSAGQVVVGYEPGQAEESILAQLPPEADRADVPLFVSNLSTMTVTDGLLYATLRDERGVASAASVDFVESGDRTGALRAVDLAPDEALRFVLRISQVATGTHLLGAISLEVDGSSQRLADLEIKRAPAPKIMVAEADGEEIKLTTDGPELRESIYLQETAGADTGPLTWSVSALRTSDGAAMILTPSTTTLEIPAYGAQRLEIAGTLPETGDYRGLATLSGANLRQNYTLRVERTPAGDQLTSEVLPPPTVIRWPLFSVDVTVPLNVGETTGAGVDYYTPALTRLVQVPNAPDGGKPSARYGGATALIASSVMTEPVGPELYRLAPNEEARWLVHIDSFRSSGHYQGTVRVATPSGEQDTVTFDLFTKDPWLLAAIAIIVGVLASYGVRRWLETGRPRAIEEMAIRRTVDRVREGIPDSDSEIRRAILLRLSELYETNQVDPSTSVGDTLAAAGKWLNNYQQIRSVLDLQDDLAQLMPDEARRSTLSAALIRLDSDLRFRKLDALGDDGLVTTARELRTSIVKEAQDSLAEAIDELIGILEIGDTPAREHWLADLSQARQLLSNTAQGGETASLERARSARDTYDRVKHAYLQIEIEKLRESVESFAGVPPGLEDTAWQELKRTLDARLKSEMSVKAYQAEHRRYVVALLTGLQKAVAERQEAAIETGLKSFYGKLGEKVQEDVTLAGQNSEQALAAYADLKGAYENPQLRATTILEAMGAEAEPSPAELPQVPSAAPGAQATVEPGRLPEDLPSVLTLPTLAGIRRRILLFDAVVIVVISIVSTLLGLRILWADAATFGGIVDYINAFLWGFGLHQLNQVALPAALQSLGVPLAPELRIGGQPQSGQDQGGS